MQIFTPNQSDQLSEFIYKTPLEGLFYISAKRLNDERGFYAEIARLPELEILIKHSFVTKQINLSHSVRNVVRGFHAENWNKLLTIASGQAYCVWADLRQDSSTFGESVQMTLSSDDLGNFGSVYVPAGVANSFCTLSDNLDYIYTVDALYAERNPADDIAISLFDPDLNINWPIEKDSMIISERDKQALTLRQKYPHKF